MTHSQGWAGKTQDTVVSEPGREPRARGGKQVTAKTTLQEDPRNSACANRRQLIFSSLF